MIECSACPGFFGIYEIVNMVLAVEFRRRLKRCALYSDSVYHCRFIKAILASLRHNGRDALQSSSVSILSVRVSWYPH
jgi:hypothetical protein